MRSRTARWLTLTLLWTTSCGDKPPAEEPRVEPPPRIVVVEADDGPPCDLSRYPEPTGATIPPREIVGDRVTMPGSSWRTVASHLSMWRARSEAQQRCLDRIEAARAARRGHLTSADAGVE